MNDKDLFIYLHSVVALARVDYGIQYVTGWMWSVARQDGQPFIQIYPLVFWPSWICYLWITHHHLSFPRSLHYDNQLWTFTNFMKKNWINSYRKTCIWIQLAELKLEVYGGMQSHIVFALKFFLLLAIKLSWVEYYTKGLEFTVCESPDNTF